MKGAKNMPMFPTAAAVPYATTRTSVGITSAFMTDQPANDIIIPSFQLQTFYIYCHQTDIGIPEQGGMHNE